MRLSFDKFCQSIVEIVFNESCFVTQLHSISMHAFDQFGAQSSLLMWNNRYSTKIVLIGRLDVYDFGLLFSTQYDTSIVSEFE